MTLYRGQSSAKSRTEEETLGDMSLMHARNRRGPSTVPCGTPDVTVLMTNLQAPPKLQFPVLANSGV